MIKICNIEGCIKPMLARGWCDKHVARFYKHGDPNVMLHRTKCSEEGCEAKHHSKGLCARHFEKMRRTSGYKATFIRKPECRFTDCKRSAKYRNLSWTIEFEDYKKLILQKCTYCHGNLPETKFGLDRIDNYKGYELSNVVPCCRYCNQMKSNLFTYEEFLEFSTTNLFQTILNRLHNKEKV